MGPKHIKSCRKTSSELILLCLPCYYCVYDDAHDRHKEKIFSKCLPKQTDCPSKPPPSRVCFAHWKPLR